MAICDQFKIVEQVLIEKVCQLLRTCLSYDFPARWGIREDRSAFLRKHRMRDAHRVRRWIAATCNFFDRRRHPGARRLPENLERRAKGARSISARCN